MTIDPKFQASLNFSPPKIEVDPSGKIKNSSYSSSSSSTKCQKYVIPKIPGVDLLQQKQDSPSSSDSEQKTPQSIPTKSMKPNKIRKLMSVSDSTSSSESDKNNNQLKKAGIKIISKEKIEERSSSSSQSSKSSQNLSDSKRTPKNGVSWKSPVIINHEMKRKSESSSSSGKTSKAQNLLKYIH